MPCYQMELVFKLFHSPIDCIEANNQLRIFVAKYHGSLIISGLPFCRLVEETVISR